MKSFNPFHRIEASRDQERAGLVWIAYFLTSVDYSKSSRSMNQLSGGSKVVVHGTFSAMVKRRKPL